MGKLDVDRFHFERPKPATPLMLMAFDKPGTIVLGTGWEFVEETLVSEYFW